MRILDLYCGEGVVALGLAKHGAVTGVDITDHSARYPYEFVQANALAILADAAFVSQFDLIWASPPCQRHSIIGANVHGQNADYAARHEDLIPATRALLQASGKPYIIENVKRGVLLNPIMLCGAQFGLKVYRHRYFESNHALPEPRHYPHNDKTPHAGRGLSPKGFIVVCGDGGYGFPGGLAYARKAMGEVHHTSRVGLNQGVPPAFGEYCVGALLNELAAPTPKQLDLF